MNYKEYFKYVLLNILGMAGISCYILADTFFVSKAIGTQGLASLNFAIPVYNFINGIGLMFGIGGATLFTILKNQNNHDKADKIFTYTFFISVLTSTLLLMTGLLFSEQLSHLLGADNTTIIMTQNYLKILLCFSPFFIINNVFLAFVRNDGAPKLSTAAMIIGSLSNIVLDYISMFIFGLGITGAALATGIAPVLSILIMLTHMKNCSFKLKFSISDNDNGHSIKSRHFCLIIRNFCHELKRIISLGISSFIIEFSSGIVLVVFNIIIMGLKGSTGVAAYGIIANISLVILAVFTGTAQGIQPLASKFFGIGDLLSQKKVLRLSVVTSTLIAVVSYCLLIVFSDNIISVFNSDNNTELKSIAATGFAIYFCGFIFAGFNIVNSAFLSATQKTKPAFVISVFRGFIIIPVVIVFSVIFKMKGVWLSFTVTELITAVIGIIIIMKLLFSHIPNKMDI